MGMSRYIKVRLNKKSGGDSKAKFSQVKVLKPRNCIHEVTACVECLESWSWDHDIDVPRNVFVEMFADGFRFEDHPDIRIAGRLPFTGSHV